MWAGMFAAGCKSACDAAVAIFFTFSYWAECDSRFWKASLVSVLFAGAMLLSPGRTHN